MDNSILELVISSNSNKKYYILKFLLENNTNEKYIGLIRNFMENQRNLKEKWTLSIYIIINYKKYDNKIVDDYSKNVIKYFDNINNSYIYLNNIMDAEIIFNSFENKKILETLYIKICQKNRNLDLNENLGYMIEKNNYLFLNDLMKARIRDEIIKKIIIKIWKDENYSKIISNLYNCIDKEWMIFKPNILFVENKAITSKQDEWIKEYIKDNINKEEKIKEIFNIVCNRSEKSKIQIIIYFAENNKNINLFKKLPLTSRFISWSGRELPVIDKKIDFYKSIKSEIHNLNDLDLLEFEDYIDELISKENKYRKEVEMQELIEKNRI